MPGATLVPPVCAVVGHCVAAPRQGQRLWLQVRGLAGVVPLLLALPLLPALLPALRVPLLLACHGRPTSCLNVSHPASLPRHLSGNWRGFAIDNVSAGWAEACTGVLRGPFLTACSAHAPPRHAAPPLLTPRSASSLAEPPRVPVTTATLRLSTPPPLCSASSPVTWSCAR